MTPGLPTPADVEAVGQVALQLAELAPRRARVERLLSDYNRGFLAHDQPLVVALVGATGAGKSTLLNALVGAAVATPGDQRPTTEQAVVYAPEDASLGALATLGVQVVRYSVHAPGPWSGHVFVDSPDINSVATAHRVRAAAVVEQADVALVVLHKGSVAEAVQAEFLSGFALRRRLLFVLNHADLLAPEAQEVLKQQVRQISRERLALDDAEVYAVSALNWQQGRQDVGERAALLAALAPLDERAATERVRRSNAQGALCELRAEVVPALDAAQAANDRRVELLSEGLTAARAALGEDFGGRIEAASTHLGHVVRGEAARRFWGPAGWWMRLTLAGTSGMGAAALLLRGSPLAAGGFAAGATLLSRLQHHTLERATERRMAQDVLPDEPSLRAAALALAGARTDALQREDDSGLPATDSLATEFVRVRVSVWEQTAHLGLPVAVARWWKVARFLLLPVINGPLFALFGHVAYVVVRGYLEGHYVGADFLFNALALAGLIAASGGGLASLTLFGVRRRVVREGRRTYEAALAELSARVLVEAREGNRPALDAARRLVSWGGQ